TRALLVARAGIEAELLHGVENAAMHRLEAVAHVRQRARDDGREGVREITLAQGVGETNVADLAEGCGFGHGYSILLIVDAGRLDPRYCSPLPHPVNKAHARCGQRAAERLEEMARQKKAGEGEAVADVLRRGHRRGVAQ